MRFSTWLLATGMLFFAAGGMPLAAHEGPDPSTLTGKVMCGYQGWFTAAGDGASRPWVHYARGGRFEPGQCSIDLWPCVADLDEDERYPTPFRHADGSVAYVFSSQNPKTVSRHFQWMKEYGIDGAFVQRFAVRHRPGRVHDAADWERVLDNCRRAAREHGRVWAVMYDLSGLRAGEVRFVAEDWRRLVEEERVTEDPTYLHHHGRPVVAVWGVGFSDGRDYTLEECSELIDQLRSHAGGEGATVMLGIPSWWRTLERDSVDDAALHEVLAKADVLSPWSVGRYRSPAEARRHAETTWRPDLAWCRERDMDFMPVVFPGFSWSNLYPGSPLDQIPRREGRFLWSQFRAAVDAGASMIYVAMFDEIDEGTAIFKCTNDPPVGATTFLTYEGLPTDHYLWLTGQGARLLRGEIPATENLPARE